MKTKIGETLDNTFFLSVFNSQNIPGERKGGYIMLAFNTTRAKCECIAGRNTATVETNSDLYG